MLPLSPLCGSRVFIYQYKQIPLLNKYVLVFHKHQTAASRDKEDYAFPAVSRMASGEGYSYCNNATGMSGL